MTTAPRKLRRIYGQWTEQNLKAAINAIKSKKMSENKAAKHYGIPKPTIRRHIQSGSTVKRLGRNTILNKEEENDFVNDLIAFKESKIPLTSIFVRRQAFLFCKKLNKKLYLPHKKTGTVGNSWLNAFLKRHPEVKAVLGKEKSTDEIRR